MAILSSLCPKHSQGNKSFPGQQLGTWAIPASASQVLSPPRPFQTERLAAFPAPFRRHNPWQTWEEENHKLSLQGEGSPLVGLSALGGHSHPSMGGGPDLAQPEPPSTSLRNYGISRRWTWAPQPTSCHQEGGRGQPKVAAPPWEVLKAWRPNHLVPNQGRGWCPRCLRQRVTSWSLMVLSQGFAQPSPKSKQPCV